MLQEFKKRKKGVHWSFRNTSSCERTCAGPNAQGDVNTYRFRKWVLDKENRKNSDTKIGRIRGERVGRGGEGGG